MFKINNKNLLLFLVLIGVISFGFSLQEVNAQPAGCCITNGGQCNPGCGPQGTSCQLPAGSNQNQCATFIAGEFCFQVENNVGVCQPLGCCETSDGTFIQATEGTCEFNGGTYLNDGPCMPPPPSGCCETVEPATCNDTTALECNGQFTLGSSCATPESCGEPPPPIFGCCQTSDTSCDERENVECPNDPFFPGGMCMAGDGGSFCEPPPTGCCVIEQGVCTITTEVSCEDQDGDYQGDDTDCAGNPMCEVPPSNVNVPTLSQWGLIAMAGILGIVGFIMLRRKRAII